MGLELQILAAVMLDLILGDPRWLPHPVRGIGYLAARGETLGRKLIPWPKLAGVVVALSVIGISVGVAYAVVLGASKLNPLAGDAVAIVIFYTTFAARDLARHSNSVQKALAAGDLPQARQKVAMIVGRDTQNLDASGVSRAAVESVAESVVDGITAPLFFAILLGPAGAMGYRAINTLDSMFGHKDERYHRFGWASARMDDVANFLPARLTAPLMCLAAGLLRYRAGAAVRTVWHEARHHASPNAGFPEAAVAGALGVQLGGTNYYDGQPYPKPTIGKAVEPLTDQHIRQANTLMFLTSFLFIFICLAVRLLLLHALRS